MVSCKCEKCYVGETKLKVSTRIKQHKRTIKDKKLGLLRSFLPCRNLQRGIRLGEHFNS